MALPGITPAEFAVIGTYVLALLIPGGLLGVLSGLRGWSLVALAPLFTYAIAGLAGPLYAAVGLSWSAGTFALATAVVCAVAATLRWVTRHRRAPRPEASGAGWSGLAQAGVVVSTLVATVVGIAVILGGIRQLSAIPQDWDAVFHANGIRLIADTGDGSLYAMGRTNWYENGLQVFYPNAYHLVAAAVYQITGASIPTVLNAHTVLIPGLLGLSLVAMVRRFGGRPLLAAATALAAVSVSSVYDLLWRGPLLPFATGVALTPVFVVLVVDVLDAPGLGAMLRPAALFVLGMAGLLCLHPAILIGAILFTVPALVQRWWQRPAAAPREIGALAACGILAAVVCTLQLAGTFSSAGNLDVISWPADLSLPESVGEIFTFSHAADTAQLRLTVVLVLGLLAYRRLAGLRWVGAVAAIFGTLFVIAASVDAPWAKSITSVWWNDRWRLIALTAVPLCVIIGHGVAEAQRWVAVALRALTRRAGAAAEDRPQRAGRAAVALALVTSAAALLVFAVLTRGMYLDRDQLRMTNNTGNGPAVSQDEIAGMQAIAQIVPPGERVLNDRGDGSAWMYALTGVKPVAGHYDAYRTGPDAQLLAAKFNQYPNDPAVRAAVQQLGVRYVQLDAGFLRGDATREPGLRDLMDAPWLTTVYRNPDVVLYEITDAPARQAAAPTRSASAEGP